MGFHYGYEKRKFDAEWTRLEQEYRAVGMDDRQIAAMKEYDWTWFCSQRTYQNRVQALPSEQCEDESEQSCLFRKFESLSCTWDTGDVDSRRFGWLSSLEDELFYYESFGLFAVLLLVQLAATGAAAFRIYCKQRK